MYEHGGPEVLKAEEIPTPAVNAGEVRVRVRAVALNHLDVWVRNGIPGLRLKYPHILGSDVAGEIDAVGEGVRESAAGAALKPGLKALVAPGVSCGRCEMCLKGRDNLCRNYGILGEHRTGGYAEYITVPAANILPFPESLSIEQAASIPLAFMTAWQMVFEKAKVQPGETVLVMAAGSGVSTAAIQLCKLAGATVIATAGSAEKLEKAKKLGADFVINYTEHDYLDEVKRLTDKRGVDVALDHTGAANWEKTILALAWGGRLVTCGATSSFEARTDLRQIFYRQITILGSTMGCRGDLFRVVALFEQGKLIPVVDSILELEHAADAHRRMESRALFGKLVLAV